VGLLILRRLVATIPVLLLVTAGVFALIHLTPGDPIDAMQLALVSGFARLRHMLLSKRMSLPPPSMSTNLIFLSTASALSN